ncbi:hypothetical protein KY285_008760 [Solanum tuberosum]|nr:hypothetical protein KY289_009245 [Solanum tuberosum]KAH0716450.1 hypothetical protein KY284_009355 [Solanum tuberosum]KAH0747103.1 hypothetical protein KY285_008760 [Solanum tuberosum]
MNRVNCPDVWTLHPMPYAGTSASLNTNVSNIQKKSRHSELPECICHHFCQLCTSTEMANNTSHNSHCKYTNIKIPIYTFRNHVSKNTTSFDITVNLAQQWNCTAELLTNPQFNGTQPLRKSTSMKTTAGPYNSSKHYNPLSHLRSQLI